MHASTRAEGLARRLRRLARVTLSFVLLAAAAPTSSSPESDDRGFLVRDARARLDGGRYVLNAKVELRFSAESLEAMENGVPLTLLLEAEVLRERALVNERVAYRRARYRIKTHALSDRYVVTYLDSGDTRAFRSFDEMASQLGEVDGFPLLEQAALDPRDRYVARLRVRLDIEALPSPLRLLAYLSPVWRLSSDWYELRLDH